MTDPDSILPAGPAAAPSPATPHPVAGERRVVFLRPLMCHPNIEVGEYGCCDAGESHRPFSRFAVNGVASGVLVGSVEDAARFLAMPTADRIPEVVRILSPESARSMRELSACGRRLDVGLGWFRRGHARSADRTARRAPRRRLRVLERHARISAPWRRRRGHGPRVRRA
jgi:hypothetical protein